MLPSQADAFLRLTGGSQGLRKKERKKEEHNNHFLNITSFTFRSYLDDGHWDFFSCAITGNSTGVDIHICLHVWICPQDKILEKKLLKTLYLWITFAKLTPQNGRSSGGGVRSKTLWNCVGEQNSETLPKQFIQTPLIVLMPNRKLLEKNMRYMLFHLNRSDFSFSFPLGS